MNIQFTLLTAVLVLATACSHDEKTTHAAGTPTTTTKTTDTKPGDSAQSQSNAKADLDHLAEIRKAVVADDSLSVAAKNVTITTRSGAVTLRGKVASGAEREAIERHARACPATVSVDDKLEVETK